MSHEPCFYSDDHRRPRASRGILRAGHRPGYTPLFAELIFPSFTLAIGHTQTVQLFGEDTARPADNDIVIIEFKVDDVDSEYGRLKPIVGDWVQQPTTMLPS